MRARSAIFACLFWAACVAAPRDVENAVSLERQAEAQLANGNPTKALAIYREAAERWRKAGNHKIYAATLDSIARIHKDNGDFDLAVDVWRRALSVSKYSNETESVLRTLSNLGIVHSAWGHHDEALRYYGESLALAKTLRHQPSIARIHNNVGAVYRNMGELDLALAEYEKALAIDRQLEDERAIASRMANIGTVHMDRGDFELAREHYTLALDAARAHKDHVKIAIRLNNLGAVSSSVGEYKKALGYFRQALVLHDRLGQRQAAATVLSNMGTASWYLERYEEAEGFLKRSIKLKEELRRGASGEIRRDYLASQIETYEWLTATYVRANEPRKALLAADSSRAKYLVDQFPGGAATGLNDPAKLAIRFLERMPADVAVVYFANVGWNRFVRFVADAGGVRATTIESTRLLRELDPGSKAFDEASLKGGRDAFASAIAEYRQLLASTSPEDDDERDRQARLLYDGLLGGVLASQSYDRLLIIPDASLAFLPFETLRRRDNHYLIEKTMVSYMPSLAVSELIHQRKQSRGRRSLLAIGDAQYKAKRVATRSSERRDQVAWRGRRRLARGQALAETYAELGYSSWNDLPGTRTEAVGIARVVPKAHTLLGDRVTEARIKKYSRAGDLAKYRIIHFATHGIALPEAPELSALVLSQNVESNDGEDGYLTMGEIAKLKIDADQVVLSACDTGLGRLYAGEGVVGLTQSFLIAGARAVSVSLWQVSDSSTAALMLRSYQSLVGAGDFLVAFAESKRAFISGAVGNGDLVRPYHWAPFVQYGAW